MNVLQHKSAIEMNERIGYICKYDEKIRIEEIYNANQQKRRTIEVI
jgi:hypothetical protein